MRKHHKTLSRALSLFILTMTLMSQVFPVGIVSAAQITNRSLTLQAGNTDGGTKPGGVVKHLFDFTIPSGTAIGSIEFKYCTLAAGVPVSSDCVTPAGLVTTSATLGSESGAATGFTMVNTTNGAPYLTRTASTVTAGAAQYQLANITNPTTTNQTFYVRISTFASTNATGAKTDAGTVAASTATQIVLEGIMPESLVFCTGATIGVNVALVPDCATSTPGAISFNQLFSSTDTATATSQMAASTNAGAGYVITVNGPTLTSGSNTVAGMGTTEAIAGIHGVSQFGLNLKANTTATSTLAVGSEIATASNGTNYRGQAATNYNTIDKFKFTSGEAVANSANGGAGGSDAQIYTVSYIVNVPGSQPAGTYTTTLTYICTPTF